jgi:glycosyltransferase involved in cell wall biosynthesis
MPPLIAVCTPTYNRKFTLEFSMACFLRQTCPNLHWIVIDNSESDDNSWIEIQELAKDKFPLTYIRIRDKTPIGALRNICLEESRKIQAEFLAFWDDDDYYPPQRIAVSVQALQENPKFDITGCEIMSVFLTRENLLMDVGPYGHNHATAATYVIRMSATPGRQFLATANRAEEGTFTRDWTMPMIMLPTQDVLLVMGHKQNTVDKSAIFTEQRKFGGRMNNHDNAKNIVRFQWIKDPKMWDILSKTFLGA